MRSGAPLVEREEFIEALVAAATRCAKGHQVALIEGPAGIGKSRLVRAVSERLAAFEVLSARGGVLEQDIAFGVVRQLFERRLALAPDAERREVVGGGAAGARRVLELGAVDGPEPVPGDVAGVLHGLFWIVANLAERRPLLLAVDDLHWADRGSLEFLAFLARRLEDLPVFLLTAVREGEPVRHAEALAEVMHQARVVRLPPLSREGVAELVATTGGVGASADLVAACHQATGGNPFYLSELLAAIVPPGGDLSAVELDAIDALAPSTVARMILLRLGRLGAAVKQLAAAASVLGDGAPLSRAAALAGIPLAEAERAADVLVAAAILAGARPLRFAHPIVRAAIVKDAPPAERAAAHRRAAELLRDEGQPVERIVPHLLASSPAGDEWPVQALREAAREALGRGVPDLAVRLLRRALQEPPGADRVDLLSELSAAELASGHWEDSALAARQAIKAAPDAAARARLRVHEAYALMYFEGAPAALHALEQGIEEARSTDPQLALLLEGELVCNAGLSGVDHPDLQRIVRHREVPGETSAERFMLAMLAFEAIRRDQPAAVVRELALRALARGRMVAEDSTRATAYYAATIALIEAEAFEDARVAVADGMANSLRRGAAYGYAGIRWMAGILATREGRLAAAEADQRACVEHAVPTMMGIGSSCLAMVLLEQGDVDAAHAELERTGLMSDERPLYVWGPFARGLVRLARGCPAEALADLEDVGAHAGHVGSFAAGLPWQAHAALAHHALGDQEQAERLAEEQIARARRRQTPRLLGIALRAAGLIATGAQRITRLTEAIDVLETSHARLELARARCDLGVTLVRAGRRRAGRELLERSHDAARDCGARGLARTTHEELRVAGARPRRLRFSGVEALTASERRVAEMAADGRTNREIAQALFVTPKTVANQLSSAYTKIGISSRRALPEALGRTPGAHARRS